MILRLLSGAIDDDFIYHSMPTLGSMEASAAREVIENNFVGYGVKAEQLESFFCEMTGKKFAFAVQSGSQALILSLLAFGLPEGAAIAIPVLTCDSVLRAVLAANYRPVLCDVHKDNLVLDPDSLPEYVEGVVAPHAYGIPLDVKALEGRGIPWIEDCATSPATVAAGKPSGSSGTTAIFSLNSTKYITGGQGGVLVTDDDSIAMNVGDCLGDSGWQKSMIDYQPAFGRLSDVNAAIALVQCGRMKEFLSDRREIAAYYNSVVATIDGVNPIRRGEGDSYYRYILHVDKKSSKYVEILNDKGIDAQTSVNPWLDACKDSRVSLSNLNSDTLKYWKNHLLSLPIYPSLKGEGAERVMDALKDCCMRICNG